MPEGPTTASKLNRAPDLWYESRCDLLQTACNCGKMWQGQAPVEIAAASPYYPATLQDRQHLLDDFAGWHDRMATITKIPALLMQAHTQLNHAPS